MTPEETKRMMDFILRSQANAMIRMDRWDERSDELKKDLKDLTQTVDRISRAVENLVNDHRVHEIKMQAFDIAMRREEQRRKLIERREKERRELFERRLRTAEHRTKQRVESVRDLTRILTRLLAVQSKRLDQFGQRP